jgi:hypothetical protein
VTFVPVAVAVPTLKLALQLLSAFPDWFAGQLMVVVPPEGGVTMTLKLQLSPVVAVAVTVVVPTGKKQSLQWLTVITPHSSLPLGGEKWTTAPGVLFGSLGSWCVLAGVVMSSGQATEHVFVPPPPVLVTVPAIVVVLSAGLSSVVLLVTLAVFSMTVPTEALGDTV